MAAFRIRALGHDFTELVYKDIWDPVLKIFFQVFIKKFVFDDKY
jgi:hypothetical protein